MSTTSDSDGLLMGIDLGSSFFKVELFDFNLMHVGGASAPVIYNNADACVEMPVDECGKALRYAIAGAIQNSGYDSGNIRAIALASQAQTFTVRTPDGEDRIPFISWRDNRRLSGNSAGSLPEFGAHCSITECLPNLTVSKLAGMQVITPGDCLLWLPSWFVTELTGRRAVDVNLAAMSGLYSLQDEAWWQEAMKLCHITPGNLPDLIPLGSIAGLTTEGAASYNLPADIPVVLAGNDQTAAAYSAGIDKSGSLLISLGTAQVAYISLPDMPQPAVGTIRGSYPDGGYYQLAADDFGAGTVAWACSVLPGGLNENDFDKLAEAAPEGCHGVKFLADGPSGSGHWIGTDNPQVTTGDKTRALIETLVERMGVMVDRLSPVQNKYNVILCGGGARSEFWRTSLSRRLGRPVKCAENVSPSMGAARMARNAL